MYKRQVALKHAWWDLLTWSIWWSIRLSICMPWQIILRLWPLSVASALTTPIGYSRLVTPACIFRSIACHLKIPTNSLTRIGCHNLSSHAQLITKAPRFNYPMTHRVHLYGRVSASVKSPVEVGVCMPSQIIFRQPYSTSGVYIFTNDAGYASQIMDWRLRWYTYDAGFYFGQASTPAAPTLACVRMDFVSCTFMIDWAGTTDNPAPRLFFVIRISCRKKVGSHVSDYSWL
jgi:hypothetical protein